MTADTASRARHHTVPLVHAANVIFPGARGVSGYDRLRRIIERHERTCPVEIIDVPRGANGRTARHVRVSDLPALSRWAHDPRSEEGGDPDGS